VEKNAAAKVDTLKQRGENKRRGFTLTELGHVTVWTSLPSFDK
jgi:hypothetical protein